MIGRMFRRHAGLTGILTAAGGLVLLAWLIRRLGAEQIWAGFRQVGWGLVPIVIVAGLRFFARAVAWRLCLDAPRTLRVRDAFTAVVCGDMIGNLTPLGPIVGEPAKAALVRRHIALGPAVTALAMENILYTLSAAAMIAAGMVALLFRFTLPPGIRDVSVISIAATLALFAIAFWLLWRQPALVSRALGRAFGRSPRGLQRLDRVRDVERELYSFASRRRAVLPLLALAEMSFHALGVLEIHITLWLMNGAQVSQSGGLGAVPVVHSRNDQPADHRRLPLRPAAPRGRRGRHGVHHAGPGTGRHDRRDARDRPQGAHAVLGGGGSAVAGAARADADQSTIRIRHSLIGIRHSAFIIGIRHSAFAIRLPAFPPSLCAS